MPATVPLRSQLSRAVCDVFGDRDQRAIGRCVDGDLQNQPLAGLDLKDLRGVVEEQRPHAEGVVQLGARRRPARIDIAHPRRTDDPHGIGPAVLQYGEDLLGRAVEQTS
jgi:hypothetical protein